MIYTFTQLQTKSLQYTQNAGSTDTNLLTFIKDEINQCLRFMYSRLSTYKNITTYSFSTVAGTQYYDIPQNNMQVDVITLTLNNVKYVCDPIDSQREWDKYNALLYQGTAFPQFFFVRRDDFGIWPIPQAVMTGVITQTYRQKDMTQADYNTGTISLTNGSATVTGSGTTFTAAMVNRWITAASDGTPYRISAYTSATSITISKVFQGTTVSGDSYNIGESPELPPETHTLIPHWVAMNYYAGLSKDKDTATYHSNMFWTGDPTMTSRDSERAKGGMLGAMKVYAKRSRTGIIRRQKRLNNRDLIPWSTTLSS